MQRFTFDMFETVAQQCGGFGLPFVPTSAVLQNGYAMQIRGPTFRPDAKIPSKIYQNPMTPNTIRNTSKSKGPGSAYRATLYGKSHYRIKWEVPNSFWWYFYPCCLDAQPMSASGDWPTEKESLSSTQVKSGRAPNSLGLQWAGPGTVYKIPDWPEIVKK